MKVKKVVNTINTIDAIAGVGIAAVTFAAWLADAIERLDMGREDFSRGKEKGNTSRGQFAEHQYSRTDGLPCEVCNEYHSSRDLFPEGRHGDLTHEAWLETALERESLDRIYAKIDAEFAEAEANGHIGNCPCSVSYTHLTLPTTPYV